MRYTLSSITITKHPGTELHVIGRRGRRAGHMADGRGQAGKLRAMGTHTEATRRTQHFARHSRFVLVLAFLCFDFFFFLFSLLRHVRFGELGRDGREREQRLDVNEGEEAAEDRKQKCARGETWVEHKTKDRRKLETAEKRQRQKERRYRKSRQTQREQVIQREKRK